MLEQWNDRHENLQLMLEVYHFARDAAVAEAWLVAQESFIRSPDLGDSLDETLALLKKHLAFEKAAATQEERFAALEKLTTVGHLFRRLLALLCCLSLSLFWTSAVA